MWFMEEDKLIRKVSNGPDASRVRAFSYTKDKDSLLIHVSEIQVILSKCLSLHDIYLKIHLLINTKSYKIRNIILFEWEKERV